MQRHTLKLSSMRGVEDLLPSSRRQRERTTERLHAGLLDSFALPDLVSALEQEFSIKVPDRDLNPRKFDSIARIDTYLQDRAS